LQHCSSAIKKLDYLEELGVNAIALMPVTEYDGDYRWGYLPRFCPRNWNDAGERVVLITNFSEQSYENYDIPNFPADGTWKIWTENNSVEAKDGKISISLPSFTAQILLQV
jgi:1,4-alpha-glucan branching enzyme